MLRANYTKNQNFQIFNRVNLDKRWLYKIMGCKWLSRLRRMGCKWLARLGKWLAQIGERRFLVGLERVMLGRHGRWACLTGPADLNSILGVIIQKPVGGSLVLIDPVVFALARLLVFVIHLNGISPQHTQNC